MTIGCFLTMCKPYHLDIFAIIVLYEKTIMSSDTFKTLYASAKENNLHLSVLLYDNSSLNNSKENNKSDEYISIEYIHNPKNPGVSAGYNVAAKIARDKNFCWLLLLDQDTKFPLNALDIYKNALEHFPHQNLIVPILKSPNGIFSPLKLYYHRAILWKSVTHGIHYTRNKSVLNSGILIKTEVFRQIGGYNEKIKLYFSDLNFFKRYTKLYNEFYVMDMICLHNLSDITNTDINSALFRFKNYCEGAFFSIESKWDFILLAITIFLRTIKLSFKYKNIEFYRIYFLYFLKNFVANGIT